MPQNIRENFFQNFENNLSQRMLDFIKTADTSFAPLKMNFGIGIFAKIPSATINGIDIIPPIAAPELNNP